MELLSPAGNFKAFMGAINAGCDAVYLGGEKYGARAYADNFTDDEIIKAIKIAHLYNVKVYLTVNTLIKEYEFKDVCAYIRPFYEAGLDACIVQDLGLISVFSDCFPKMECHVSTQGFATGLESVRFYKSLGAKRVVLARELSLNEIKYIKDNEDIELETFIHGAMCYSYSGECLFSSCLGGRSGNRGRCAGPCRLPYKYIDEAGNEGKETYFLSMKDQCTIEILPKLIDAGIDSLKIEGRMKKPEYTAFVTSIYRKYINLYNENPNAYKVDKKDLDALRHIYLRSEIGEGYYFKKNGRDMITLSNPAYLGNDDNLMKETDEKYLSSFKKIPISVYSSVYSDSEIILSLSYKNFNVSVCKEKALKAINKPTGKEDIKKQLVKTGDTCFEVSDIFVDTDECSFVPVKALNEIRREACEKLEEEMLAAYAVKKAGNKTLEFCANKKFDLKPILNITSLNQLKAIQQRDLDVYVSIDYKLLEKLDNIENMLVSLPDVIRNKDISLLNDLINEIKSKKALGLIVHNYEELNVLIKNDYKEVIIGGPELYTFNKESLSLLNQLCTKIILPYELSYREIESLEAKGQYLFVYGKLPLMHTSNCVYKTNVSCTPFKGSEFVYIKDRTNAKMPVYRDCKICSNIIYNSVPTCLYNERGIDNYTFLLCFTDESNEAVNNIIDLFFENDTSKALSAFTKAYYKRGVE